MAPAFRWLLTTETGTWVCGDAEKSFKNHTAYYRRQMYVLFLGSFNISRVVWSRVTGSDTCQTVVSCKRCKVNWLYLGRNCSHVIVVRNEPVKAKGNLTACSFTTYTTLLGDKFASLMIGIYDSWLEVKGFYQLWIYLLEVAHTQAFKRGENPSNRDWCRFYEHWFINGWNPWSHCR